LQNRRALHKFHLSFIKQKLNIIQLSLGETMSKRSDDHPKGKVCETA